MTEISDAIAVVGLAAKFPGACDLEQFWLNLVQGRESISFLSEEQLAAAGVPADHIANPAYVKAAPLVPDVELFDARLFRMTPREAALCDPQIRLFLEVTHSAIEHAGYDPYAIESSVGVFASGGPNRYAELHLRKHPEVIRGGAGLAIETLNNIDYVATMASYKLDLRGPSMTVVTACSSTLVALHLACQSIRLGECDAAVVGGTNVEFPYGHGHWWTPGGVRTPDGHCRPFDAAASGTIFGSGAAAVMLKPMEQAVADGDHIKAVIRGVAVNNDGSQKVSFSAPSVAGQVAVIMEAMSVADVSPADISYVEAHGTGTALGDPIEVAALAEAYRNLSPDELVPGTCAIGSVKSNVGHLGPVAGIAGLIKTVLSLEREQLPPSINFSSPNPGLELDKTPFYVNDRLRSWPRESGHPRRAGLSSLGIGGTNVHVVLEEGPAPDWAPHDDRPQIVVWSGQTEDAERALRDKLARFFAWRGDAAFSDTVATLQHGRTAHPVRAAAVASSAAKASSVLSGQDDERVITSDRKATAPRPVAMVFPGQGAQHERMAADLYGTVRAFTLAFDECVEALEQHDVEIYEPWIRSGSELPDRTTDTMVAQPLLFAVEYALAEMWRAWGLTPTAVLGHSVGELVAACVAEVFDLPDAARLIAARARAIAAAPSDGGMLAVAAAEQEVLQLISDGISLAAVNGPRQVVLSGSSDALADVAAELRSRRIAARPLRTSHPFHHSSLAGAAAEFEQAVATARLQAPTLPLFSGATGAQLTPEDAVSPAFWAQQIVRPVRFWDALDAMMAAQDERILLEAGPSQTLTALGRQHPAVRDRRSAVIASLPASREEPPGDRRAVLGALAGLWVEGHGVDWEAAGQPPPVCRVPLPGYPYQRARHWFDAIADSTAETSHSLADGAVPPTAEPATEAMSRREPLSEGQTDPAGSAAEGTDQPFSVLTWTEDHAPPPRPRPRDVPALVLLPDGDSAMALIVALQQAGFRTLRLRAGSAYARIGDEARVRPGEPADLGRALSEFAEDGLQPEVLIHARTLGASEPAPPDTSERQLDDSFFSLLALIQRGVRTTRAGKLPGVLVLTSASVDVAGGEPVEPFRAMLHGVIRTLAKESPGLPCKLIDVGASTPETALVAELEASLETGIVALRGYRRWVRRERPFEPEVSHNPPIRRQGVYLITGGLGGLGRSVAHGLARTGFCPRLVLVGRHGLGDGQDQEIAQMEALGAAVRVIQCDVADARQLRRALDIAAAQFGPVNGVLHLAGVPGDGMLQFRTAEAAAAVLRPKVLGTLNLEQAFADRPALDFFVSFSSRAAVDGLVGSGDYAAANAFQDAHALGRSDSLGRRLSINWPTWSKVGMAAESEVEAQVSWETTLSQETHWTLDEHRLGSRPLLPGTAHLEFVLLAYREREVGARNEPVVLRDVVFQAPLICETPRRLRVVFVPDAGGHRFEVSSRPVDDEDGWQVHVTGAAVTGEPATARENIEDLKARLALRPAAASNPADRRLFVLGPRWRNIEEIRGLDGERLVAIALPSAFDTDLDEHPLHPTLLDSATAAAREEHEAFHLPFIYRRLVVHAPLPSHFYSHVRRHPSRTGVIVADIDLYAPDGQILAEIEGFTMRRVEDDQVVLAGGERSGEPAPARPAGIDPDDGVRLFMTLLGSRTPPQVVVRPFVDGRPVAIADAVAAPSAPAVPNTAPARSEDVGATLPDAAPEPGKPAEPTNGRRTQTASSLEDRLRDLWVQALGVNEIAADDDFFDLGGNSLTAVELMGRIRDDFGIELNIGLLFDAPTLGELTAVMQEHGAS